MTLDPVIPIVHFQPANNVRMAIGKKQTEQFSVFANYIDNLKYRTVVYIKL